MLNANTLGIFERNQAADSGRNGSDDVIIYTIKSYILEQNLPNAHLIIYPDSAHGSLYQYPELFVRHVLMFLSAVDPWAP